MRLTIQLKLQPTLEQADLLRQTLEKANEACDAISEMAWDASTFHQIPLHKLAYYEIRNRFNLSSQVVVRCIAKVADAYKLDRKTKRIFKPLGALAFDNRILSYKATSVSIWTIAGRQRIPFVCGEHQQALLHKRIGESDLAFIRGDWYLLTTAEVEPEAQQPIQDVLGIDLGVTNIAVDSDGDIHQANTIKNVRYRHRRLRQKLQKKGTLGSRRRLRALAGQERRFATWVNHNLSKYIVAKAKHTKRAIAMEDLTHIRSRIRAKRSQRAILHSWAFAQLRRFIEYKAQLQGVPLHFVDPRNTSRTCPVCGYCAKENRKTQSSFLCLSCGFAGLADKIAAENICILGRVAVNLPYCSDTSARAKPPPLGVRLFTLFCPMKRKQRFDQP
jgi:putative transposase